MVAGRRVCRARRGHRLQGSAGGAPLWPSLLLRLTPPRPPAPMPAPAVVVTGSQDRTAKVWRLPDLVLGLTLKGHKRGVWAVAFSPVDQAVATASGALSMPCHAALCCLPWPMRQPWPAASRQRPPDPAPPPPLAPAPGRRP